MLCCPCLQPELIEPVRHALDYYTEMQQALELEKLRLEEGKDASSDSATALAGAVSTTLHVRRKLHWFRV